MLYLDIQKVCNNIGINDPQHFLHKNGFSHVDATRLLNNRYRSLNYAKMEKLCLILNCTPNELLTWRQKDNTTVAATHPLHRMKHVPKEASITGKLQALPPEKIEEVQRFLDGLAGKEL